MSENEFEKRIAAFDEERNGIYATPVSGLPPMSLVLYLGAGFALAVAASLGFVSDRSAQIALLVVCIAAMAATVITVGLNWWAYSANDRQREAKLADVDERRRQFLREQ